MRSISLDFHFASSKTTIVSEEGIETSTFPLFVVARATVGTVDLAFVSHLTDYIGTPSGSDVETVGFINRCGHWVVGGRAVPKRAIGSEPLGFLRFPAS